MVKTGRGATIKRNGSTMTKTMGWDNTSTNTDNEGADNDIRDQGTKTNDEEEDDDDEGPANQMMGTGQLAQPSTQHCHCE